MGCCGTMRMMGSALLSAHEEGMLSASRVWHMESSTSKDRLEIKSVIERSYLRLRRAGPCPGCGDGTYDGTPSTPSA